MKHAFEGARRNLSQKRLLQTAPAREHGAETVLQPDQQTWNGLRRILQIGIDDNHAVPSCLRQAGEHRELLADIALEWHNGHPIIVRGHVCQYGSGALGTRVIHEKDFVRKQLCFEDLL